jgi:OOP family OmpA-OmpF porin
MKMKLLGCAIVGALIASQTAMAADYDDRWYLSGTLGVLGTDPSRDTSNAFMYGVGFGRMITPNVSVDLDLDRANTHIDPIPNSDWDLTGLGVTGRYHFIKDGRNWWPYLSAGIGVQRHDLSFGPFEVDGSNLMTRVGAGLQGDFGQWAARLEGGVRWDFDDETTSEDSFRDLYAAASLLYKLGDLPAPAVTPPPPPPPNCADFDDDRDGVNNCNDRCPNSQPGQAIGADGCPVTVVIDLRGVNFDFDKDTLRPDAIAILDQAVDVLRRNPQLRVEVAGHTDSIGTDAYNQDLSQRRAAVVYQYLTNAGIDSSRLAGPNGYGESRPIDTNETREGRARNRRTELNVQN